MFLQDPSPNVSSGSLTAVLFPDKTFVPLLVAPDAAVRVLLDVHAKPGMRLWVVAVAKASWNTTVPRPDSVDRQMTLKIKKA